MLGLASWPVFFLYILYPSLTYMQWCCESGTPGRCTDTVKRYICISYYYITTICAIFLSKILNLSRNLYFKTSSITIEKIRIGFGSIGCHFFFIKLTTANYISISRSKNLDGSYEKKKTTPQREKPRGHFKSGRPEQHQLAKKLHKDGNQHRVSLPSSLHNIVTPTS